MNLVYSFTLIFTLFTKSFAFEIIRESSTPNLYIEIKAQAKNISVHCSPVSKDGNNFNYIYVRNKDKLYEFLFRRPWDNKTCQYRKAKVLEVVRSAEYIKIVGGQGHETVISESHPDDLGVLSPLVKSGLVSTWIFYRLSSKSKCFSYFEQDCLRDPIKSTFKE